METHHHHHYEQDSDSYGKSIIKFSSKNFLKKWNEFLYLSFIELSGLEIFGIVAAFIGAFVILSLILTCVYGSDESDE